MHSPSCYSFILVNLLAVVTMQGEQQTMQDTFAAPSTFSFHFGNQENELPTVTTE